MRCERPNQRLSQTKVDSTMKNVERTETKLAIGFSCVNNSLTTVAEYFGIDTRVVRNWKRKVFSGTILTQHGGYRWARFSPTEKINIQQLMFTFITEQEGMVSRSDIQQYLHKEGIDVSKTYITRVLQSWNWSFKVPTRVNIQKFTLENIEYYFNYYAWSKQQEFSKLKFCDESHFNSCNNCIWGGFLCSWQWL